MYTNEAATLNSPEHMPRKSKDHDRAATAQFVSQLEGTHRIELLRYHRLGVPKYEALSKDYALSDLQSLPEDRMNALVALIRSYGIEAQIGG